jgi:hypothetical protein
MDLDSYYQSLSAELTAVKDRVRQLIDTPQWLTDGQWKESVLRSVLRRHAPANVGVGSGFVVRPDGATGQIDVLLYDASKPVLFRDSELVMVTPDACLGVIEVKSRTRNLLDDFDRLSEKARFLQSRPDEAPRERMPFVGFFSYEWNPRDIEDVLPLLRNVAPMREEATGREGIINHVALGPSHFIRFWESDPQRRQNRAFNRWRAYHMADRAFGYFMTNAVEAVSSPTSFNTDAWFPRNGKEMYQIADLRRWG